MCVCVCVRERERERERGSRRSIVCVCARVCEIGRHGHTTASRMQTRVGRCIEY